MPHYPNYPTQPSGGELPSMYSDVNRASDLRYSSGTAPFYQSQIDAAHGRHLAGVGEVQDEGVQPAWADNELRLMAEADDVQGDGIFDPPGKGPNINPDAGVFANRASIPGYWARERMYAKSEVRDITTGRPIVPVNGGAVSMDSAAQIAFLERGMYEPPTPIVGARGTHSTPLVNTANVRQQAMPIQGLGQSELSRWQLFAVLGVVGLAAGAAYASFTPKRRRSS